MLEIIPAINCHLHEDDCVVSAYQQASGFAQWIHLDVADGIFTFNKTWANASQWKTLIGDQQSLKLEVHLMVEHPEMIVENWLQVGAKRIIVHIETVLDGFDQRMIDGESVLSSIAQLCDGYQATLMLSSLLETPWDRIKKFSSSVREFQVLAVTPGSAGQMFLPLALEKIAAIRADRPQSLIEVDGGINEQTASFCLQAGADILVSSSYLFSAKNPATAFSTLSAVQPRPFVAFSAPSTSKAKRGLKSKVL